MLAKFLILSASVCLAFGNLGLGCAVEVDRVRIDARPADGEISSEELMARVRDHRDEDAFAMLVQRHSFLVRHMVIKGSMGLDPDDVAQEIWLKAFLDRETFPHAASFNYWFPMVVRNCIIDEGRKLRRKKRNYGAAPESLETVLHGETMEIILVDETTLSPPSAAEKAEAKRHLHAALEALSEDQREMLRLRYVENLSLEEVGLHFGQSRKWATPRVVGAERVLRTRLINHSDSK